MKIIELLLKLGFTPKEAKVYLSSLEIGVASAQDIGKKAGLKRTTAYAVLGSLVDRGVVSKTQVKGKTRFVAEPPERLDSLITELQQGMTEVMPQLAAIHNKNEVKPKITFFEGDAAIQKVYDDTPLEIPGEILEWNTNAYFERFPKDHGYIKKRIALGIKAKRIAGSGSVWDTTHKYLDAKELSETQIVPRDVFWPEIEVNIYNDKVSFLNYAENMSVIIQSRPIAEAMRQAYRLSWEGAKNLSIKK